MTILAQRWLEQHAPTKWDSWLRLRLEQPPVSIAPKVEHLADRIVMVENPTDLLCEMVANNQINIRDMYKHTRLPSEAVWIEWHDGTLQIGMLIDQSRLAEQGYIALGMVVASKLTNRAQVMFTGKMRTWPVDVDSGESLEAEIAWTYDGKVGSEAHAADHAKEFARAITTAVFVLFVMQHPRLTERERVDHPIAIQRKRAAHKKQPLLSYERVYIRINKDVPASVRKKMASGEAARAQFSMAAHAGDISHRRYHKVLGHFRTYYRGEERERCIWIEPHWRGDPTLGVVLHEHRVEKGKVAS